jgi:hypothetical protein
MLPATGEGMVVLRGARLEAGVVAVGEQVGA